MYHQVFGSTDRIADDLAGSKTDPGEKGAGDHPLYCMWTDRACTVPDPECDLIGMAALSIYSHRSF